MRYQILGPARALQDDGTPVPLGGTRLRATLTALALRPGRHVPVAVLVGDVWGDADTPPADAPAAVQALIARLRRSIGREAVTSVDGGYALAADPDDVDLYRFERLTTEGTRALAEADPTKAVALLDDALSLWQSGPALADLPEHAADSARWAARRLDARRARLAASLALGRAQEVLPELVALCEAHPLDEPLQALRLRALHAAGRTAEALDAYEDVRKDLADRLGVDPSTELRTLHAELLEPAEVPAVKNAPVRAEGPRPPTPSAPPAPPGGNLRARLTSFVGREADIGAIRGDLARARLVTLLGPGGAGKTRLSQEAAEAAEMPETPKTPETAGVRTVAPGPAASPWPDGVWMVELAPVDDPDAVPDAVLNALGARQTVLRGAGAESIRAADRHADDPLVRLTEHCSRRRMLLLLDNCEHLVDAAARLAEHLLAHCPGLTVLATSREPLGVPGEWVRPVDPLPPHVALRLFGDRGAAARPGFRIDDDPDAAAEICRRLDGLPLAIELAAARLRMLTPRQIADRLDDRFRLLTGGARTVLPRQQTLRAVVDWSWELLDEEERRVLCALSVFAGGCDLAAAEAVCGPDAFDLLGSLVDKSLVVAAPSQGDGGMRYHLLETVAEYAAERLEESGARAGAERRHLVHYRELARTTDPLLRSHAQQRSVALIQGEYENLRTALRHAAATDEHEVLCLVHSLAWYWQMRDLRTDSRHWAGAAMELSPDPFAVDAPIVEAEPLYERCTDAPPPMSPALLQEARRGVRLIHMANMDHDHDAWATPESIAWLSRVVATYRPGLPQTCRQPGSLWFFAAILTGSSVSFLYEVLNVTARVCRELGYEWDLAFTLQLRANLMANLSAQASAAQRDAEESLEIFVRLGDAWGCAEALSARGEAYERCGEYAAAAEAYRAATEYAEKSEAHSQTAVLRARLAGVLIERGEGDVAEAILRDILADRDLAGYEGYPAARLILSTWLGRTGRPVEAREQLEFLRGEFASGNLGLFDGIALGLLAWVSNLEGKFEESLELTVRALERSGDAVARMIAPQTIAVHLMGGAASLVGLATREDAADGSLAVDGARLLGAYAALLPEGHYSDPQEVGIRDHTERTARSVLGDAAYRAAYAEGARLSEEQAGALVRTRRDQYRTAGVGED
ncbi:BTAD domain-containing putative transcriptional regulator [Streptomyces sp. NPDC048442]|uniref:AfsR/SARP family transcriptional regulator n=1 Tax=Streptomyces sp. NPDC048442 TaxID=3154823 RepID=UPI0034258B1E